MTTGSIHEKLQDVLEEIAIDYEERKDRLQCIEFDPIQKKISLIEHCLAEAKRALWEIHRKDKYVSVYHADMHADIFEDELMEAMQILQYIFCDINECK